MKKYFSVLLCCIFVCCSVSFVSATAPAIRSDDSLILSSVNVSNERITANDTNGFKSVMLSLIGDYETTITDYTYQNTQGYTQHSITVERDWSWIMSCALFTVVVFCTFLSIAKIMQRF